jgi:hypothetical protein
MMTVSNHYIMPCTITAVSVSQRSAQYASSGRYVRLRYLAVQCLGSYKLLKCCAGQLLAGCLRNTATVFYCYYCYCKQLASGRSMSVSTMMTRMMMMVSSSN